MPPPQKKYRLRFGIAAVAALMFGCASPAAALDKLISLGGVSLEPLVNRVCKEVATINDAKQLDDIEKKWSDKVEKAKAAVPEAEKQVVAAKAELDAAVKKISGLQKEVDYSAARLKVTNVPAFVAAQLKEDNERLSAAADAIVEADQKFHNARTKAIEAVENKVIALDAYAKVLACINKRLEDLTKQVNAGAPGPPSDLCITGSWKDEPKNGYVYTTTLNFGVRNGACTVLVDHDVATLLSPPQHGTATLRQDKMATGLIGTYLNYRAASGYRGTDNLKVQRKVMNLGHEETYIQNVILDVQ